jgi:hypothetical protein
MLQQFGDLVRRCGKRNAGTFSRRPVWDEIRSHLPEVCISENKAAADLVLADALAGGERAIGDRFDQPLIGAVDQRR